MNVTTSANWQRPPVGIVRVERFLCDELAKLYGSRFKLCVWQEERFVEWQPQTDQSAGVNPIRQEGKSVQLITKSELPPIFPILSGKQALLVLAQGLLSLTPRMLRPYFNRLLYALKSHVVRLITVNQLIKHFFWRLAKKLTGWAYMLQILQPMTRQSVLLNLGGLFSSGDILISVGLDWNYAYYKQFFAFRKCRGVKVVTCCYDLIPVIYPQYCANDVLSFYTSYFLEVADGSDLILCISKQSEKDLNELLHRTGGAQSATHVFPLGDNVPLAATEELSAAVKAICQEPFILFVSTIERRKNHEVLYRAYHLLCSQGKRADLPKLVFVGMQGWGVGELMKDIELDPLIHGLIVRLNHVTDTELRALYEAARFCVFPSLYEGWGLPVGEALSLGKAVICSDRGSLPEVGGDSVRYVSPWDPQAWADEIYRMATDADFRSSLEAKVRRDYQTRKWTDAAASVKQAIDSLGK